MVLLAAWQALLGRYAGTDDVVVGSPVAGRDRLEVQGLIGFFVNTLALRGDLSGDPSFTELVGRAKETVLGAQSHAEVPFERLVDELGVERSLTHTPLFQVMFTLEMAGGGGRGAALGCRGSR
jgi:non-ribosomal peptide synthetase component F